MNKRYSYPRVNRPYWLYLLISAMAFVVLLVMGGQDLSGFIRDPVSLVFLLLCGLLVLSMCVLPLLWILWTWNDLRTIIVLDDAGIYKKDSFREVRLRWHEIVRIDKDTLYFGGYPSWTFEPPQDLLIHGIDGRKIKVFKILRSQDSEGEGISDFEKELCQQIDIDKQPKAVSHERSTALLMLICGLSAAIVIIYNYKQVFRNFYTLTAFVGSIYFCIHGLIVLIKPSKAANKKQRSAPPDSESIKRPSDNSRAAERGKFKPVSSAATEPEIGKAGSASRRKMAAMLNVVINIFLIGFVYIELGPIIIAHIIAAVLVIESAVFFLYAFKSKQEKKGQALTNPVDPE